jgi:hypothetical protein
MKDRMGGWILAAYARRHPWRFIFLHYCMAFFFASLVLDVILWSGIFGQPARNDLWAKPIARYSFPMTYLFFVLPIAVKLSGGRRPTRR